MLFFIVLFLFPTQPNSTSKQAINNHQQNSKTIFLLEIVASRDLLLNLYLQKNGFYSSVGSYRVGAGTDSGSAAGPVRLPQVLDDVFSQGIRAYRAQPADRYWRIHAFLSSTCLASHQWLFVPYFEERYNILRGVVEKRHYDLEEEEWYLHLLERRWTPEMEEYYLNDLRHKVVVRKYIRNMVNRKGGVLDGVRQSGIITRLFLGQALADTSYLEMSRPLLGPPDYKGYNNYVGVYLDQKNGSSTELREVSGYFIAFFADRHIPLVEEEPGLFRTLDSNQKIRFLMKDDSTVMQWIYRGDTSYHTKLR